MSGTIEVGLDASVVTVTGDSIIQINKKNFTFAWDAVTTLSDGSPIDGTITYEVYLDGTSKGTVAVAEFKFANIPQGNHTLGVRAIRNYNGAISYSAIATMSVVSFFVPNAPTGLRVL